jgi:hypothetical protein
MFEHAAARPLQSAAPRFSHATRQRPRPLSITYSPSFLQRVGHVVNPVVYPALEKEAEYGGLRRTVYVSVAPSLQRKGTVWQSRSEPVGVHHSGPFFVRDEEAAGSNPSKSVAVTNGSRGTVRPTSPCRSRRYCFETTALVHRSELFPRVLSVNQLLFR